MVDWAAANKYAASGHGISEEARHQVKAIFGKKPPTAKRHLNGDEFNRKPDEQKSQST